MSRRHSSRAVGEQDTSPEAVLGSLLDKLCVRFGFCLPPDARAVLRSNPPQGARAFTDAVIAAEGLDPLTFDSVICEQMVEFVEAEAGRILYRAHRQIR